MKGDRKIGALITGGDFQGLAALRTLARKQIPVILLDSDLCIGRFSRYCRRFVKSPPPAKTESYLDFLINLTKRENVNGWVVFPNSDEAVNVLSRYKSILEEYYRVPTPCWDVIKHVYVKKETYRTALQNAIPIPKTYEAASLQELMASDLHYPLVVKPSIRDHFYSKTRIKGFRVDNETELVKTYRRVRTIIDDSEIVVQEFIPGGPRNLYSYCPFLKNGQIVTGLAARRSRQHPMDFGHASTYVEVVNIPEMKHLAEKFLRAIGFYGIAEVEFMQDPRDRKFKLLEVNPRIWGWHGLAIAAGVDLPYILYQDMTGQRLELPQSVRPIKWVRLTTDIPTVLAEIIKGNISIREYMASMRGQKEFAVLSADDPWPSIMEMVLLPYLWRKRGF